MKRLTLIILGALLVSLTPMTAHAQEVDVLVDKLVQKGVLSQTEGDAILKKAHEKSMAESSSVPEWVKNVKLKGDFRLRYQYDKKKSDSDARNRERIRYRLGIEGKVNDQFKVGAGLASGGSDPRSTNQTLQDSFSTKGINLDYAYGEWAPTDWLKIVGGKFTRKAWLWQPTDLLWDGDINPEGQSAHVQVNLADNLDGWWNMGLWIVDENGKVKAKDPFLYYNQVGVKGSYDKVDATVAGTYYAFEGLKGHTLDSTAGTNTLSGGNLRYNYDVFQISGEVGASDFFGGLPMHLDEHFAVFGDYVNNTDPSKNNTGWSVGAKLGSKKIKEFGTWQVKYIYAALGMDAFPDAFPDSDRYGGATDVKANEVIFELGLNKNLSFGLDYYNSDRDKAASDREQVLQADLMMKF